MLAILIILVILIIGSNVLIYKLPIHGKFWNHLRTICTSLLFLILVLGLFVYFSYIPERIEYHTFKDSIEELRQQEDGLKSTFITMKIININEKLAKAKHWNKSIFGLFIPDSYANNELIRLSSDKKSKK